MSVNWIGLNRQVKYLTVKLLQYSERSARLDIKPTENYSILIGMHIVYIVQCSGRHCMGNPV